MKFNHLILTSIILLAILSIGVVSATSDNATADEFQCNQEGEFGSIDDSICSYEINAADVDSSNSMNQDSMQGENVSDVLANETTSEEYDSCVVYVGQNITEDGGNGSYENPFEEIDYAYDSIVGYKDSITINIFEGTYYLESNLQFNTSDLVIQSVSGKVTFKNLEAINGTKIGFGTIPKVSNFTMNNIIFDYNDWPLLNFVSGTIERQYFYPYYYNGYFDNIEKDININCNNCTFIGLNNSNNMIFPAMIAQVNYTFNSCNFINCSISSVCGGTPFTKQEFNYCIFSSFTCTAGVVDGTSKETRFNGCWLGQNTTYCSLFYNLNTGKLLREGYVHYTFIKYAVFDVFENYLGDNKYEIVGKLMWNDTTTDNIDKLSPMSVRLSSSTGDLPETAILENGSFRVIYTSNATDHDITATLDNEVLTLNFNTTDMIIETSDVIVGQNPNVTVTLPQAYNGTVTISVNNKSYEMTVNDTNVITYIMPDVLPVGTYEIVARFSDEENHVYAFNSTNIIVSKMAEYTFDVTQPIDVKVGDMKTIAVTLPSDATGNITVTVGENVFEANVAGNVTTIEVSGFVEGNNTVKVVYSGDEKYEGNSTEFIIPAEKVAVNLGNETLNVDVAKGTTVSSFNIALPSDATGNLTVNINGKDYTQELVNGSATVNIPELNPGNYNAIVTYSGDGKYSPITTNTTVSIPKPVLTSKNFAMLYTSGAKYIVRVTLDGKAVTGKKVTFTINGKKTTADTDKNGYASVKITLPPKSKAYTVTATYLGVKVTNKVTVKSIVTAKNMNVKKSAKKLTIKVTLKKVNKKYLKGKQVTLKFNGKTYKVKTNSKGVATFTINKKVLSKLKTGKKYAYKVTYGKDSVSKKVTVKK